MSFFVGLAYEGKDIVFRFIIEYSSLNGFWPLGHNRSIFLWGFLKDGLLAWWNIWVSIILLSFALRYFFNVNGKATIWHTPCLDMSLSKDYTITLGSTTPYQLEVTWTLIMERTITWSWSTTTKCTW